MSINTQEAAKDAALDQAAIVDLRSAFASARRAFQAKRKPTLQERRARIEAVIHMLLNYRERISALPQ